MNEKLQAAIKSVSDAKLAFCKFITPNDTGKTGGHQAGFYVHKNAYLILFDAPGEKGSNKSRFVTINWQNDFETSSRFIYYGVGTRNEYRITRFGRNFPFLTDDNVGDLFVLCKDDEDYYEGWVLSSGEEIEDFLGAFNLAPNDTNALIDTYFESESALIECFNGIIQKLENKFPSGKYIASSSRDCYNSAYGINIERIKLNPDELILEWVSSEYQLFRKIEEYLYSDIIRKPFETVEELLKFANTILNRRKSRAGKSLENHLEEVFLTCNLNFETQKVTEDNKRPDFVFPGVDSYSNPDFPSDNLFMLAAKTTCKDRWRQVLNEADRISVKHLFTLQPGISKNQLGEMEKEGIKLVVPRQNVNSFPIEYREKLLTLKDFIEVIHH